MTAARVMTATAGIPELILSPQRYDLAYAAATFTYVSTYVPSDGAPEDVTKYQFEKTVRVFDTATGAEVAPGTLRPRDFVHYYDPVGLGTDPADTVDKALLRDAADTCDQLQAWVAYVTSDQTLHDLLAAGA